MQSWLVKKGWAKDTAGANLILLVTFIVCSGLLLVSLVAQHYTKDNKVEYNELPESFKTYTSEAEAELLFQ